MAVTEESRLARKKQNRQAQVVYRERKRAADNAQKDRINRLENVVEQMSSVFMGFADELLGYEDLKKNRNVVDCLRKTIEAMVHLGAQVVDSEDPGSWTSTLGKSPDSKVTETAPQTAVNKPQNKQSESPPAVDIFPEAGMLPQTSIQSIPDEPPFMPLEPLNELPLIPAPPLDLSSKKTPSLTKLQSVFGNGWLPYHGNFGDMTPPFEGVYVSPESFSFRLVERTLATTYNLLFEDERILGEHTKSIFRYSLQSKDRQAILTHVRWMLGPGRHRVFKAADIPASEIVRLLGRGHHSYIETHGEGFFREKTNEEFLLEGPMPPSMLSAIDVQRKLEQLGARQLNRDVLELNLPGSEILSSIPASDAEAYRSQYMAEAMTIRLSIPLLIYNLSMIAVCLEVGPGFKSEGLYGAVEASVIPV